MDIKERNKKALSSKDVDDKEYYHKLLLNLRKISRQNQRKLQERGIYQKERKTDILRRNKRAVSSYRAQKRAVSAHRAEIKERRIQSAQINKLVREKQRFDTISHRIYKRDLKILATAFQAKIERFWRNQRAWIQILRFGRVIFGMVDLYHEKVNEINELEKKCDEVKGDRRRMGEIVKILKM
jgi:hypothetical protein